MRSAPVSSAFPGEKSPGLIEAGLPVEVTMSNILAFPGEKSPGLIEAGACCWIGSGWCHVCFRGRNPPASLKHSRVTVCITYESSVSGGEIPRPH